MTGMVHRCVFAMSYFPHGISIWSLVPWYSNQVIGLPLVFLSSVTFIGHLLMFLMLPSWWDWLLSNNVELSTTFFIYFMSSGRRIYFFLSLGNHWVFSPYSGRSYLCDAWWGSVGILWWYLYMASSVYPGIYRVACLYLCFQSKLTPQYNPPDTR